MNFERKNYLDDDCLDSEHLGGLEEGGMGGSRENPEKGEMK